MYNLPLKENLLDPSKLLHVSLLPSMFKIYHTFLLAHADMTMVVGMVETQGRIGEMEKTRAAAEITTTSQDSQDSNNAHDLAREI